MAQGTPFRRGSFSLCSRGRHKSAFEGAISDALAPRVALSLTARLKKSRKSRKRQPFQLTVFDSPTLHISSDLARAEMDVSATDVVLTMKAVSGSVWMLDGVDR